MFPRQGVIEIELLRRYGRTPAGTRATGWFELAESAGPCTTHCWEVQIRIADDPRPVNGTLYFPWPRARIDDSYTRPVFYRGACQTVTAADLFEYAAQDIIRFVEVQDTPAKHQRFRVVRLEWREAGVPDRPPNR
jgi:hypothetical protein